MFRKVRIPGIIFVILVLTAPGFAQQVEVEQFVLDNGMKFLLLPRTDQPNSIVAGWLAKVGSVNEHPGITGISHFFEHMMFKGTNTIGTRDPARDADFRRQQKQIKDQILQLTWTGQYKRFKAGDIDDPWDAANDTEELKSLRARLKQLIDEHGEIIEKDEFSKVYTNFGGSFMNAFTTHDLTFYFITVPSNKFELWAWMESDRLSDSVFREFFAERDVVHEERRLRTESTPTGVFQEQFDAMFWESSPYSWPVIGWTSDLNSYTMEGAQRYFDIYYRPNNLVGVVVGDFDPVQVKSTIREYFSRLSRGPVEPPPVKTIEMKQLAEKRMLAECDCQPEIEIRYHTVPFNHVDEFPLQMLAEILNGRTGRLYKSMVEGLEVASGAGVQQDSRKYAGLFSFSADVKGDATPTELEYAWYTELEKLKNEPVGARELQKVKNNVAADSYRRLQSGFFLMIQLGFFEGLGGWEYINESPVRLQAVTAEDIQRVVNKYFDATNRSAAIYTRKEGTGGAVDDELASLPPQAQGMVKMALGQMAQASVEELRQASAQIQQQIPMMEASERGAEMVPAMRYLLKQIQGLITERENQESDS